MTRVAQSFADLSQKADKPRQAFDGRGFSLRRDGRWEVRHNNCCREENGYPPTSSIPIPTTTFLGVTILNKPAPAATAATEPACPVRVVVGYMSRDGWAIPVYAAPTPAEHPEPAPSVASQAGDGEGAGANPHFARLGGVAVIEQLVERFYALMDSLPEAAGIRAMHGPDLAPVKAVLVRFLTEWTGGPQAYSAERGHPRLRRKHLPFAIGAAERDAWMACMTGALDGLVADPELKDQLTRAFFKTADFIRNDKGSSHDHHSY